jgi:hypothetical protein
MYSFGCDEWEVILNPGCSLNQNEQEWHSIYPEIHPVRIEEEYIDLDSRYRQRVLSVSQSRRYGRACHEVVFDEEERVCRVAVVGDIRQMWSQASLASNRRECGWPQTERSRPW